MKKNRKDIQRQVVSDTGNVRGTIVKNHILTPEEMGDRALMFARIDLPAGSMIADHAHTMDAEAYYMLEGEATVTDNDVESIFRPGDVIFTADGNTHSIRNHTDQPAAFLAVIFK